MSNEKKLSKEEIQLMEAKGLLYAGFDKERDTHVFNKQLARSGVATTDPRMLCREWYNPTDFRITVELERDTFGKYIHRFKDGTPARLAEFEKAILEPQKHLFCPHGYYKFSHLNGSPLEGDISLLMITGRDKFKGVTKPSRPEVKTRVFK